MPRAPEEPGTVHGKPCPGTGEGLSATNRSRSATASVLGHCREMRADSGPIDARLVSERDG